MIAYVQNWHLLNRGQSYFEQEALPSPLQHAWSLSIEEQFYLVWPLSSSPVSRSGPGSALPAPPSSGLASSRRASS